MIEISFVSFIRKEEQMKPNERLTAPQNYDSWPSLLEAAKVRKHEALLDLARNEKEGEVPPVYYH